AGAGALAKYDGKWIVIDHTLIDSYVSSLKSMASESTGSDITNADKSPTAAQVQDAVNKVQTVNKQYIFTGDRSKAVLTQEQYIGKETVSGRTMYHYKVGYNKANLQAYVTAVGQALDSSQLNDWSKKVNNGKSISEAIDMKSLKDEINKADSKYTFEMWADKGTKLVSKLKFTDTKNAANSVTISQDYTGGVVYPFSLGFSLKGDDGSTTTGLIGFTVNSSTNKVGMTLKADSKDSTGTASVNGSLDITPGNQSVTVEMPVGATPIMTILKSLGLGDMATPPKVPASISPQALINPATNPACNDPKIELSIYCSPTAKPGTTPTKCPVADKATCAKLGFTT
ncbi:MAG TPA: hypothetical protein VLG47_07810, partial [Candidatus Saccharimonadales bacterium]|nr:hypothetical protein [Candidatus Saccharimonadales bacterium]